LLELSSSAVGAVSVARCSSTVEGFRWDVEVRRVEFVWLDSTDRVEASASFETKLSSPVCKRSFGGRDGCGERAGLGRVVEIMRMTVSGLETVADV
jgi:hypothetical protein